MRKKGFTLIELLVVIAIIAMLMAILLPALGKVKRMAMQVICGTNLKGLGNALNVYANDYDDEFPVQGRGANNLTWADFTDDWDNGKKDWSDGGNITVGASLYLLVREADVAAGSFICPAGAEQEFTGVNNGGANNEAADLVNLWDFGNKSEDGSEGPVKCVSYSYHMPYAAGEAGKSTGTKGSRTATGTLAPGFAVMADKSPFFDRKLTITTSALDAVKYKDYAQRIANPTGTGLNIWNNFEEWQLEKANAQPHDRNGQNVLYVDAHTNFERRSDVGVKNDNCYTRWDTTIASDNEGRWRRGRQPATLDELVPQSVDDSVLVNDILDMELQIGS